MASLFLYEWGKHALSLLPDRFVQYKLNILCITRSISSFYRRGLNDPGRNETESG